jgi:glycosyltransferase involved in cell wall biosynthesis
MVSVIIPCWNQEKYIADCLQSVIFQSYRDIEVLVVDDYSTDESRKIIEQYVEKHPEIRAIFLDRNYGVSAARNRGIIESVGNYVVCIDGDDMLLPNSIKIRVKYLEDHPGIWMVWGNAYKINEDRKNYNWSYSQCVSGYGGFEVYSRRLNTQTIIWRREVFEKYGLYYEGLKSKEDKELLFRLGIHPESPFPKLIKAKKLDNFMAIYRRHPMAKHKRRVADRKWFDETEKIFNNRIKRLKRDGITKDNTRFLNVR